jgi:hypothetical protein
MSEPATGMVLPATAKGVRAAAAHLRGRATGKASGGGRGGTLEETPSLHLLSPFFGARACRVDSHPSGNYVARH